MEAKVEIHARDPEAVIRAIEPDIDKNNKFDIKLVAEGKKVVLTVESDDEAGLMAGVNSYIKLIKLAREVDMHE